MDHENPVDTAVNQCLRCGACCAAYTVRFPACEVTQETVEHVPEAFTISIDASRCAMRGTEARNKRCCALTGQIGHRVSCSIYASRPTVCRNFDASWREGVKNYLCDRARAFYGLPPYGEF